MKLPLDSAKVGDGVTHTIYSDSHAMTIIARTGKTITARRDTATLLNGPSSGEPDALKSSPGGFAGHVSGSQRYSYEADPDGGVLKFSRRVLGNNWVSWKLVGHKARSPGNSLGFGRYENYDYNF